jgi:hypothetical protein
MKERFLYYNTCDFYAENTYSKVMTKSKVLLIHSSFVMTNVLLRNGGHFGEEIGNVRIL